MPEADSRFGVEVERFPGSLLDKGLMALDCLYLVVANAPQDPHYF